MRRGSKRKFGSDDEPFSTMAPQALNGRATVQCRVPTPETQELYNKMRQEEERLTPESLSQIQNGPSNLLQPPSPSQATASSPSPSYASTTHSIGQAMDDMRVGDQLRVRKQGRQGPLSEPKKRRAALMRKLKACSDCRGRKVKCSHSDFRLFEAAYQASKQAATQPINLGFRPSPTAPQRPRLGNPADLIGIGVGQNPANHPPPLLRDGFQGVRDETYTDFDPLEQTRNQQSLVAPHVTSFLEAFGNSGPPTLNPNPQYLPVPTPPNGQATTDILIGKQVLPFCQTWACSRGNGGSTSSVSPGGSSPCNQQFNHLEDLKVHFMIFHASFDNTWQIWCCVNCGHRVLPLSLPEETSPCPQCGNTGFGAQTWQRSCYAKVPNTPRHTSLPLGRVSSQGGSPSNHSSWTSYSAPHPGPSGGHNNTYMPPTGGYGYGNGTGQYFNNAAGTNAPSKSDESNHCCGKPSPAVCCPDGNVLIADMLPFPNFFSNNKGTAKISFLRHACPAAVVLAVFVYTLINTWVATGHFGGGLEPVVSHLVSFVIPDGRVRIPELSVACIAAGLVISWLFRHVRLQYERRHRRGVFDNSPLGEERFGRAGVAAAS